MARGIPNPDTPAYIRMERRCAYLERRNAALTAENGKLKVRIVVLELHVVEQAQSMQTLKLQIEELRRMVFGKKRSGPASDPNSPPPSAAKDRAPRGPASYQRPKPEATDSTITAHHPLTVCPDCGDALTKIAVIERFVEDLLPLKDWYKALKRVTRHLITTGFCKHCRKRVSAIPLPKHLVTLGENVAPFVAFATVILRLSYAQVEDFLHSAAHLTLSDGEIANLLGATAQKLTPAFTHLTRTLQAEGARHYDETSWKTPDGQGNFAWIMTSCVSTDTIFALGRSRGKGVAEGLRGNRSNTIGITDDYAAYQNLFTHHQLCFAHVHRKLRDLASSDALSLETRAWCHAVFTRFAELYADVRTIVQEPFLVKERIKKKSAILQRLSDIACPDARDPLALAKIKARLRQKAESYVTCVIFPDIPPDNNTAERRLRHLVLKRKSCQGSKTQQGADMMARLYSVLLSLWWKDKPTFFHAFAQAMQQAA